MSDDTKAVWEYAKKHHIPYETVIAALEMVQRDPKLDIFNVLMHPTDSQVMTLKCKALG